jgi:hypothetical protein
VTRTWKIALLALACACQREDLTQTIVWVDAEPAAREVLSQITIEVIGPADHRLPPVEPKSREWPLKLVLAPKDDDASRRFTLHFEARDAEGTRVMTLRIKSGFVRDRARFAKVVILDACVMQPQCESDDAACHAWSLELPTGKLGRSESEPRRFNASCSPDETVPPTEPEIPTDGNPPPVGTTTNDSTAIDGGSGASGGSPGAAGGGAGAAAGAPPPPDGGDACGPGFVRNVNGCVDINECETASPCGDRGWCTNLFGSYECQCDVGSHVQAGSCADDDECATNNGGCETTCLNTSGSFACTCAAGEWIKADRKTCGRFGAPKRLGYVASVSPTQPRFAFDGNGSGLAVWTQSDGTNSSLWIRRYVAGTGWAMLPTKVAISQPGNPSTPSVALDSSGQGVVVWLHTTDARADIWAGRYDGQTLGRLARIEATDVGKSLEPLIALNSHGDGFATWSQPDGMHSRIWVNRFSSAQGWTGAQKIPSTDTEDAFTPRLAIDSDGNANLVWTQSHYVDMATTRFTPWSARFDPTVGRWRTPVSLDDSGTAGFPDTQMHDPDGSGLAVWGRLTNGSVSVLARKFSKSAGWGDAIDIASGGSELTSMLPRVALSPSGLGAAIWVHTQASVSEIWVNRYDGGSGTWAGGMALSAVGKSTPLVPQIAMDPVGDGFALWPDIAGTSRTIWAWRLQADAGFIGGVRLTSDTTAAAPANSMPQIAVDAQGNAIAIWDVWNAGQYDTWAARFE